MNRWQHFLMGGALAAGLIFPTLAQGGAPLPVMLRDHRFSPAEIHVKANAPAQILLTNADSTAEEFDSSSLHVEKVVAGGSKGIVRLAPLPPGRYPFMGEYHADTAQGVVVAE
jgi:hypothetical protein